jgi:hypothetical protein
MIGNQLMQVTVSAHDDVVVIWVSMNPACDEIIGFKLWMLERGAVGLILDEIAENVVCFPEYALFLDLTLASFGFDVLAISLIGCVMILAPRSSLKAENCMGAIMLLPYFTNTIEDDMETESNLTIQIGTTNDVPTSEEKIGCVQNDICVSHIL